MGWLKAVEPGDQAQADFAKAWRTVASSSLTRHDDLAKSLEKAGVDGQIGVQTATHLVTQASTRSFQRHLAAEGPTLAVEKAQAAAAQTSTTPAPGAAGDSMVLKLSRPSMLSADVRLRVAALCLVLAFLGGLALFHLATSTTAHNAALVGLAAGMLSVLVIAVVLVTGYGSVDIEGKHG
jgi:hypothetical protein